MKLKRFGNFIISCVGLLGTRKLASMQNCSIFRSTDLPIFNKRYDTDFEHRSNKTTVMKMASAEQTGYSDFQLGEAHFL
jgi:hypothetical protein